LPAKALEWLVGWADGLMVYISVSAVTAAGGFALTVSPFFKRQKGTKSFALAYGASLMLRVPSLRCPSGGITYGLLRDDFLSMCAASPHGATRLTP
jgi:hypothetical protein